MVPLDQPAQPTFKTYSDADKTTLADPTTVTIYVRNPATGVVTPYTWAGGQVVRDSLGTFHYPLPDDVEGLWQWRWKATGAVATSTLAAALCVSEAFPAMLVGLDDVKTDTNITSTADDDELLTFIYTASAVLLNHPAYRVADVCRVQEYTQDWLRGGDTVILDHYPVTAVTSVTEYVGGTGTVLTEEDITTASPSSDGYRIDSGGLLRRLSGGCPSWFRGNVRVVYTAGSASVPWDVRIACLLLVEHLWETQRGTGGQGLPSGEQLPEGQPDFTFGSTFILPNRVRECLTPYAKAPAVA